MTEKIFTQDVLKHLVNALDQNEQPNAVSAMQYGDTFEIDIDWGESPNNRRKWIGAAGATENSAKWSGNTATLKTPYPSDTKTGDILFLVCKSYRYNGSSIDFIVDESVWTRLGDPLEVDRVRALSPRVVIDADSFDVFYRYVESDSNFSYETVQATSVSWPAPGYFYLNVWIMGYKSTTYPTTTNYAYANTSDTSTSRYELVATPSYDEFLASPITSTVTDSIYEDNGKVSYIPSDSMSPWGGPTYNYGETDYIFNDALVIDMAVVADASVYMRYDVEDRYSSTNQDGWIPRVNNTTTPSLLIGDAMYHFGSESNTSHDFSKNTPGIPIGVESNCMRKTFAITGYHSNKIYEAVGFSSMKGIVKFTPNTAAYPDTASFAVYVNGSIAFYMNIPSTSDSVGSINATYPLEVDWGKSDTNRCFQWDDGISIGMNINNGDEIYVQARSTKSTNETYQHFDLKGYPMNYDVIMSTDLRDSGGHKMNIIRMTDFGTTYPIGGLVIIPQDFGLNEIMFMQIQPGTAYADSPESPSVLASQQTASAYVDAATGQTYWKINVFVPDPETGLPVELAAGASLAFPDGLKPTIMVMGA